MLPKEDIHFRDDFPTTSDEKPETEFEEMNTLSAIEEEDALSDIERKGPAFVKKKRKSKNLRDDPSVPITPTELFKDVESNQYRDRETLINVKRNESLCSYIEMCVHCDLLNLGFGSLSRYVRLHLLKVRKQFINGPKAFNLLLHGFASKANIDKLQVLMSMMDQCGIKFTSQTFAACFECFGRLPRTPEYENLLNIIHEQFVSCVSFFLFSLSHKVVLGNSVRL
jgi:hypothetical protein